MNPFAKKRANSVSAWGEQKLIAAITRWLGDANPPAPRGIGDDCAVFAASPTQQVVTVDPVVFGRHFDAKVAPADVGAKLLKRNLSDIAAMGAEPTVAVISLALDPRVSSDWLGKFYRGLARAARRYGVAIVGGDVAQAENTLVASLTLIGRATGARVLTRTGAKRGDWIFVSGELGGSLAGKHFRFEPRLPEGAWLARQREVRSLMDVSDGLAKDLFALLPPNARPAIQPQRVPISRAARARARVTRSDPLTHALTDGEDYELLFTVNGRVDPKAFHARWRKKFQTRLTCLGRIVAATQARAAGEIDWEQLEGYEHFR